jgi:predicted RNA-binding protein YlqC (UPF0109 family)
MLNRVVEYVVKTLVDKPELATVVETQEEKRIIVTITVNEQDLGRVIGKDGNTIRAIRALAMAVCPEGHTVTVDIAK